MEFLLENNKQLYPIIRERTLHIHKTFFSVMDGEIYLESFHILNTYFCAVSVRCAGHR